ncbi:probable amidase At4g34880 isoform X2 [Abrus precatorius]|uniref:Probable amidase At4g34880 isoform X2 n=1 Tax=Abrus precatorius TaxID=3816 RepID=A0A8B8KHS5_ABRPR|nr:probable amidase At4g34880 isoform X2 [Abrus precatorius]
MASNSVRGFSFFQLPFLILLVTLLSLPPTTMGKVFSVEEATIYDLQHAFRTNQLTSRKLVEFYLKQIETQNPVLRGVLELNPDALAQADRADQERSAKAPGSFSALHGIPILLKDNIATKDKMNTTAGSYALLGSVVPRDAGVVTRLRKAGAIILGKASLSEWAHYRSNGAPSGWSARDSNSVVGIKPTVGLTSRAGVVPITPRQDTVGPICRTVSDAALVLETIVGIDTNDKATIQASKYIPKGGYAQFLKKDGLRGKRLGVVRLFYNFGNDTFLRDTFKLHLETLRRRGAVLVDKLEIDNINEVLGSPSEGIAMAIEFKSSLNAYLRDLVTSPVRSLADVIDFNKKHPKLEKLEYGQDLMVEAQKTSGTELLNQALLNMTRLSQNGFEKLMEKNKLDALVVPFSIFSTILAIGGHPGVTVPAGYEKGMPFGICFAGLQGSEPKLIEIAYSFEQATVIRKPPPLRKLEV